MAEFGIQGGPGTNPPQTYVIFFPHVLFIWGGVVCSQCTQGRRPSVEQEHIPPSCFNCFHHWLLLLKRRDGAVRLRFWGCNRAGLFLNGQNGINVQTNNRRSSFCRQHSVAVKEGHRRGEPLSEDQLCWGGAGLHSTLAGATSFLLFHKLKPNFQSWLHTPWWIRLNRWLLFSVPALTGVCIPERVVTSAGLAAGCTFSCPPSGDGWPALLKRCLLGLN